ncbi:Bicarbonate transporter BicA [Botrimarina colliarenosi]|uniref:Bicarbonate transporter BicA n=1 Tax=Botrimarina colliarenosi TaxID=2528001 RepID=A0A5C6AA61_9BACT|nr:SulP family inorganic anion transporter [Botrimarina colliarenosi]TWT95213.1 Bicarbonate transporter BicA [Botrimarina colliarenosi]
MIDLLIKRDASLKTELLSGLTVALALVPEAVAFAFVAGVDPSVGLWAAFFVGFITSLLGGRPGMISGATGAMAVVMTAFVVLYGLEYLFAAVVLCGLIQITCGLLGVGKFIRLLPHPVMLGFVNGLAIVIGLAQFEQLKTNRRVVYDDAAQAFEITGDWLSGVGLITTVGLILFTMAIIHFLPKLTKAVPGTLVAIIAVTLLVNFTPISSVTVNDSVEEMKALAAEKSAKTQVFEEEKPGLLYAAVDDRGHEIAASEVDATAPSDASQRIAGRFAIPAIPLTLESLLIIGGLALTLASVGLIESLMTLTLIDELTETRGSSNRECMAQGLANMVSGLFGSMGGCAMIGQSMINIRSGGRHRLSGVSAALFLLAFIVFPPLWQAIGLIPVPALIGVMFIVVIATFEWTSLRLWNKIPLSDTLVIVAVSAITVMADLAIAVASGVVISALVFAWQKSHVIAAETSDADGVKTYKLEGPLFFGAVTSFKEIFTPAEDPQHVTIEFGRTKVYDHSAMEAINGVCAKYRELGKEVTLKDLSDDCREMIDRADRIMDVNVHEEAAQVAV